MELGRVREEGDNKEGGARKRIRQRSTRMSRGTQGRWGGGRTQGRGKGGIQGGVSKMKEHESEEEVGLRKITRR